MATELLSLRDRVALMLQGICEDTDLLPVVRLYMADGSDAWLLTKADRDDPNLLAGLHLPAKGVPQTRWITLHELTATRSSLGSSFKRDVHFSPDKPLSFYIQAARPRAPLPASSPMPLPLTRNDRGTSTRQLLHPSIEPTPSVDSDAGISRGSKMSVENYGRVPFIPAKTLRQHKVYDGGDDRFRSAARLRQALYREENAWPIGSYTTAKGKKRRMGNYLAEKDAANGANFISPEVGKLVRTEIAYREDGALIDITRLQTNLLSSHPAVFNFFGPLKLDLDLATAFLQSVAPDYAGEVSDLLFEHSPARRHPLFTNCRTAFDVLIKCTTVQHKNGFIAVELKLSETMQEGPSALRPRWDELSRLSGLYKDPDHPALRSNPLQLLWRQHLLAHAMIMNGLYSTGRFIIVAPRYNEHVNGAVHDYRQHLANNEGSIEFDAISFEDLTACIERAGAKDLAQALRTRYCDYSALDELI